MSIDHFSIELSKKKADHHRFLLRWFEESNQVPMRHQNEKTGTVAGKDKKAPDTR